MAKVRPNPKTQRPTFFREWRKFRHLTLERLAERLEVTAGALSQLERGDVQYTQPMLEALADALNCEPADLITRSPLAEKGLQLVWDQIPQEDRAKALQVLAAFAKDGTHG
jgi:transcriptional regulator with XRE-family HTH domain